MSQRATRGRRLTLVLGLVVAWSYMAAAPAAAQQAVASRFAIDTVASVDEAVDDNGDSTTNVVLDAVVTAGLGRGFEVLVRPIAQRLTSGEWNRQIWIAALRWEHQADVSVRVDAGLIPSPVGAGNLMLRPHLNPTISLPASLFVRLPLDPRAPRPTLLGAIYPFGVNVTASGRHWDARGAVIETSPLRPRRIFYSEELNPPRFTNIVVGGGVTPVVGLRVGASVTRGGWQEAGESPVVTEDRDATIVTIEAEFAAAYTKLSGEWVHDWLGGADDDVASGWFAQGQQTLTPRWFVAGRVERMDAPATFAPPLTPIQQDLTGFEEIVGYRITPEITVRAGHRARRAFGRPDFSHQMEVSVAWWRRWL